MGSLFRGLVLLFFLAVSWLLLVLAMGIPSSWIRVISQRLPETPFAAEAGTISYDLIRGVTLRDARIFSKGDVGLPLVSADTVRLAVNPLAALTGGDWLREVWISGGTIRAMQGVGPGSGTGPLDFGNWNFQANVQDTRIFGERVVHGKCEVALSGARLRLNRAEGEIGEEAGPRATLQGSLAMDLAERSYQSSITWNGYPMAIESFLTALDKQGALDYFRLFTPGVKLPSGDADMSGNYGENWTFNLALSGAARDCSYRGVDIRQLFLNMQFHAGEGRKTDLAFDPVVIIRQDGLAAGGFSVDFSMGDIRFDGYSTCPPGTLVRLVAPDMAERLTSVRAEGPVRIHAGGTVNLRDLTRNSVTLFLEGQKLGLNRFLADRMAFTAKLTGLSCEIHDLAGECYGGSFTGQVDLVGDWTPEHQMEQVQFSAQGGCQNMDGRMLARAGGLKASERYDGKLSAAGTLSGVMGSGDRGSLAGSGWLKVSQGRLFRFPLFGPLSDFLSRLIPGLDPSASLTDGTADWRLEDGAIRSDSIKVGGGAVSLNGHGFFSLTNSLNYDIQLKLMNTDTLLGMAVRAITLPVSKLFEFRLRGTTQSPHWYPINFSADLFERMTRGGKNEKAEEPPRAAPAKPEKGGSGS
jgi:hypothetical protein